MEPALAIINAAATAYRGVIPDDCWCEPYMPEEELRAEIAAGIDFWVYEADGAIIGIMGRQPLTEVTLIRHAYVSPAAQLQGIGAQLLGRLLQDVGAPVLVGTWAAAWWAIRFYEKHGFKLVTSAEKDRLLRRYWTTACQGCSLKSRCTTGPERRIPRWEHEHLLEAVQERLDANPEAMRQRRETVEHPFGTMKARMGATHFLTKTLPKVAAEMALSVLAYNLTRVMNIVGVRPLIAAIVA